MKTRKTKTRNVLIVTTVAAAAMIGGLTLAGSGWEPAQRAFAAVGEDGGRHFGRHGPGHRLARLCGERRDARLQDMVAFVESFVDFTPEQAAAWSGLTAALGDGSTRIGAACSELEAAGRPESAPGKLARLEVMLEAGLETVREVRPAFDGFYATLDAEQKQAIDRLAAHRRR